MRILAAVAALVAAMVYTGPASATTNPAASVDVRCLNGQAVATFVYSGFSPSNHLTAYQSISVNGYASTSELDFDGPGATDTQEVFFPFTQDGDSLYIEAKTTVVGGASRVKAEADATVTCSTPPPPNRARYNPKAWAQGPCGDPMYRFWLDNRRSNRPVVFMVRYLNFDTGWRTLTRTVPRGAKVRTGYHHVRGFTPITIRARGRLLYSALSAAPGNYRTCWR